MSHQTATFESHIEILTALRQEAIESHQRRMIVVAGDLDWCSHLANTVADRLSQTTADTPLWIAREEPEPPNRLQQIIGSESQLLIFNAHHGFDPNLFGAAAGTVTGGGLLLLLTPDFDQWHKKSDPVASRIAVYPHPPESITNRYIERLMSRIKSDEKDALLTILKPSTPSTNSSRSFKAATADNSLRIDTTADQQQAIDAIIHTASGHRHRPLVMTADRGRGKSAALGIAAAQLIKAGKKQIVVTAPGRSAVNTLFKHIDLELTDMGSEYRHQHVKFIAPDQLVNQPMEADLILVDEAAAIASPILKQILKNYSRVIFSTTTHGYEGSGQGFALRFLRHLKTECPNYTKVQLTSPIRWADGDPVERVVNRMLILDAEPEIPKALPLTPTCPIDRIEQLNRTQLADDEPLLRQLFGLLVLAHYRTTPLDLRQLLDGSNLTIYSATIKDTLVATALVADEGGVDTFDEELVDKIWLGKRRPQGHLLPQTLIAHLGIKEAAPLRCRRIIRIAVHPALQRRGIGRALMEQINIDATTERIDLLGTSYGATTDLIQFWNQNRLTPIFIGSHRNASSGTYALTQIKAISNRAKPVFERARDRFQNGLIDQLRDPLQQLEHDIVSLLLKPVFVALDSYDLSDIDAFIDGNRRYETAITPLIRLLLNRFNKITQLSPIQQQLLIFKLLQNRSWKDCAAQLKLEGKSALQSEIRKSLLIIRD